jgi:hypothetical protein
LCPKREGSADAQATGDRKGTYGKGTYGKGTESTRSNIKRIMQNFSLKRTAFQEKLALLEQHITLQWQS